MHQEFYQRGLDQMKQGNRAHALQEFDRALRINPQFAEAYYRRAQVRFDLGDRPGALADYTQALQLQPSPEAYLGRALVQLSTGEAAPAILDAETALKLQPNSASAANLLATAYRQMGNTIRAIAAYKQAATLYIEQKDKPSGQRCLENIEQLQAMQRSAAEQKPIASAQQFLQYATEKLNKGQYRSALEDFNWAIQVDPQNATAYSQRALVQMKLGYLKEAMQDLSNALRLNPQDLQIWLNRGQVRIHLRDALGAIEDFNQALQSTDLATATRAKLYVQRGHAYRQLKQDRQAIDDYCHALQLQPHDPELYCTCADARSELGDPVGAIQDYQKAANLWLNQGNWQQYQTTLNRVQGIQASLPVATDFTATTEFSTNTASHTNPPNELRSQLLRLVGGNQFLAERLLNLARQKHPQQSEEWYLRKVILDVEADRQ
ncbi:MAG: tetratricopeptide repeat protein [Leptolyngbyaceae cyanobacterium CRU_2_3]|nr:tetratricopeptide repeat protein [Leptolyngbyaceae cyanobacterium CRU_2_3]